MKSTYVPATAPRSAQTETRTSADVLSIADIDALLEKRKQMVADKTSPIDEKLKAQYAECIELANEIKAFNPEYKAPWEVATPLMLGHAIKDWLAENGGSATTPTIINQFNQVTSEQQIVQVLKSRIQGGKHRLWDYNQPNDTYTVKANTNTKNN